MKTKQLDNGILNNYATEPDIYYAAYPSFEEQQNYRLQGAIATILVTALICASLTVTAIS